VGASLVGHVKETKTVSETPNERRKGERDDEAEKDADAGVIAPSHRRTLLTAKASPLGVISPRCGADTAGALFLSAIERDFLGCVLDRNLFPIGVRRDKWRSRVRVEIGDEVSKELPELFVRVFGLGGVYEGFDSPHDPFGENTIARA
jgi:hypothetical protein